MEASTAAITPPNDLRIVSRSRSYGRNRHLIIRDPRRALFASRRSPVRSRLAPFRKSACTSQGFLASVEIGQAARNAIEGAWGVHEPEALRLAERRTSLAGP